MLITPKVDGVTIVLIGAFNPRIFRPKWFRANGIVGNDEADAASIEIIHQSITAFSFDWAKVRVDPNRFSIETTDPPFIRIHDVILKTFKECLMHTPVNQFGINRVVDFDTEKPEIRNRIGELLAPTNSWGAWAPKITYDLAAPRRGGVALLQMMQTPRDDGFEGSVTAAIRPSTQPSLRTTGIHMEINDHYVVGDAEEALSSDPAMVILEGQWDKSLKNSEWIIDQIMSLVNSQK
jgi:hypothetical protein